MADKSEYLTNKVKPLLEPMLVELLAKRPRDTLSFMKTWLKRNGPDVQNQMLEKMASNSDHIDIRVNEPTD